MTFDPYDPEYLQLVQETKDCGSVFSIWLDEDEVGPIIVDSLHVHGYHPDWPISKHWRIRWCPKSSDPNKYELDICQFARGFKCRVSYSWNHWQQIFQNTARGPLLFINRHNRDGHASARNPIVALRNALDDHLWKKAGLEVLS